MSDRSIRERTQGRPLTQRLDAHASALRSLMLRANPGVPRTASSDLVAVVDAGLDTQIVSINVTSGRWVILAEGTIIKGDADGSERYVWTTDVLDPATGASLTLDSKNMPKQQVQIGRVGQLRFPVCMFGDFIGDIDEVTVVLLSRDQADDATAYSVSSARLTLIPA